MTNITPIMEAVISLAVAIVTVFLLPLINEKVGKEKLTKIEKWVRIAVQAAEQVFTGTGMGEKKKEAVLKFLDDKGFFFDEDAIDALIESAVLEMKKGIDNVQ